MSKKIVINSVVSYNGSIYTVKDVYSNGDLVIENESETLRNISQSNVTLMY